MTQSIPTLTIAPAWKWRIVLDRKQRRLQLRGTIGRGQQVATLAVQGASHLLEREIDPRTHADLLNKLELELANG